MGMRMLRHHPRRRRTVVLSLCGEAIRSVGKPVPRSDQGSLTGHYMFDIQYALGRGSVSRRNEVGEVGSTNWRLSTLSVVFYVCRLIWLGLKDRQTTRLAVGEVFRSRILILEAMGIASASLRSLAAACMLHAPKREFKQIKECPTRLLYQT